MQRDDFAKGARGKPWLQNQCVASDAANRRPHALRQRQVQIYFRGSCIKNATRSRNSCGVKRSANPSGMIEVVSG